MQTSEYYVFICNMRRTPGRREHKLHETLVGLDTAKALVHSGDVSDETYVKRLVEDTGSKFGKLDMLVNNAARLFSDPSRKPPQRAGGR